MIAKQPDNKPDDTRQELTRKLEEKDQQRKHIMEINSLASTPVIADLAEAGFYLEWVSDLYFRKLNYKNAIPVLLKWSRLSQERLTRNKKVFFGKIGLRKRQKTEED
jgi:hypothetical protein